MRPEKRDTIWVVSKSLGALSPNAPPGSYVTVSKRYDYLSDSFSIASS